MRFRAFAGAMCVSLLVGTTAFAGRQPSEATRKIEQVIAATDLKPIEGCKDLATHKARIKRMKAWAGVIDRVVRAQPRAFEAWLTGQVEPPVQVKTEAVHFLECMIRQMIRDASRPDSRLVVAVEKFRSRAKMRQLHRIMRRKPSYAARLIGRIVRSSRRNAKRQGDIWRDKLDLKIKRRFGPVSSYAARLCMPGRYWKPWASSHRVCWFGRLSPKERQREVLIASSPPGLSRHHWGTDHDLFTVDGDAFLPRNRHFDELQWLRKHAQYFGFYLPYDGGQLQGHNHIAEPWHWSYFPIAEPLQHSILARESAFGRTLTQMWRQLQSRWNHHGDYFSYVVGVWARYLGDTTAPPGVTRTASTSQNNAGGSTGRASLKKSRPMAHRSK